MTGSDTNPTAERDAMPFMAPCRILDYSAPLRWLKEGYADMKLAPRQSLTYGVVMAIICLLLGLLAIGYGGFLIPLAFMGGIIFIAPVLCLGLYAISAQLERKEPAMLGRTFREAAKRRLSTELVFALILLVVFLVWARAFSMVQVFFPENAAPTWEDIATYVAISLAVGCLFGSIVFAFSAFSLPMIMHRDVDAVTAAVTSINAVLRNKGVMFLWAMIIVASIAIGIGTFFIGAIFLWPLIGLATWHAYLDTIDAAAFPRHAEGITAKPRHATTVPNEPQFLD
jgi:uncharacterized membrane protein